MVEDFYKLIMYAEVKLDEEIIIKGTEGINCKSIRDLKKHFDKIFDDELIKMEKKQ